MSDSVLSGRLTRRQFMKTTAATAAVVAVADKLFGGPVSSLVKGAEAAVVKEDKWIPSSCYLCSNNCGTLVHRVNGVAVKIDGNPAHPKNQGKLCARGNAGLMKLYNPWRVKNPVKRTNPEKGRGVDPKWQEITWDEALDTVGQRMGKIRATDPRKLVYLEGWGIRLYGGSGRSQVGAGFGTPNWMSGPGGMTCFAGIHNLGYVINGTSTAVGADWNYCKYHLTIGSSVGLNKSDTSACREFWKAKDRGMKFVTVDTRLDKEGTKADEWIPIRGGTDLAFLMAVANVILYEIKEFDSDFIKKRTNGPYLIRSDNGLYVRSSTEKLKADPTRNNLVFGKPYIWDPTDNKAKVFDDPTIKDFALEGSFTVEGVECRPSFDLLKRQMKDYTPEWAANICTVPAATTRRIAGELIDAAQIGSTIVVDGVTFPYRPVAVDIGRGGNTHKYGALAVQATHVLDMLLGSCETPGGNVVGATQATGVDGVNAVTDRAIYKKIQYPPDYDLMITYWPISYKAYWATHDAFINPAKYGITYKPDMLLLAGANPIFGFGSPDFVTESLKTFPFIATISYHFDEPTELADVVLPDPGFTEWLHDAGGALRQPLLDTPLYNSKLPEDILIELAARGGYLADWNNFLTNRWLRLKDPYKLDPKVKYTQAEIMDRALKSKYGDKYGLEWFKVNGVAPAKPTPEKENYGYYFNPKTRYPLYFEHLKWSSQELKKDLAAAGATHPYPKWQDSYDPLPQWRANPTYESKPEFDLFENNFRTSLMSMGFSPDNPWTYDAMKDDPYPGSVWINKETAKKKGLKDGDLVWVESFVQEPWSKTKGEVFTSEAVHPDGCIIGGQWGRWAVGMNPISKERPHHNSLLSIKLDYVDHFSGNIQMGSKVKIYKV